jgi:hypothetical protein
MHMEFAQREASIRARAYAIWEQEGRPDGREWDHWERASREIMSRPIAAADDGAAQRQRGATPRKGAKSRVRQALKSAIS